MQGESKQYPERFVKTKGQTQVRFNRTQVTKTDEEGEDEDFYEYDFVMIDGEITRKKLIDAMIRDKYDVNDEFNIREKASDDTEYVAFIDYRDASKTKAIEIMNEIN